MEYILLITFLLAYANALPAYEDITDPRDYKNIEILLLESAVDQDGGYSYSFENDDGSKVAQEGQRKIVDDEHSVERIRGSYSYTDVNGQPVSVSYTADENGFRAFGAHLPTPPPIPEEIMRSLKLLATAKPFVDDQLYDYKPKKKVFRGRKYNTTNVRPRTRNYFRSNAVTQWKTEAPRREILPAVTQWKTEAPRREILPRVGVNRHRYSKTETTSETIPENSSDTTSAVIPESLPVTTLAQQKDSTATKETDNAAIAAIKDVAEKLTQTVELEAVNVNEKLSETNAKINKQVSESVKQTSEVIDKYTNLVSDAIKAADIALVDITTSEDSLPEIMPVDRHRGRNKFGWSAVTEAPYSDILPPVINHRHSSEETTGEAILESLSQTTSAVTPESSPETTSAQQTDSTATEEIANAAIAAIEDVAEKLTKTVKLEVANVNEKLSETSVEINKQVSESAKQTSEVIDKYTTLVSDVVSSADEALVDITTSEDSPPEIVPVERHRGRNKFGWNAVTEWKTEVPRRRILPRVGVSRHRYSNTETTSETIPESSSETAQQTDTATEETDKAVITAIKDIAEKLTQTVKLEAANINENLSETSAEINKQVSEPAIQSKKVIDKYTKVVSDEISTANKALIDITTSEDSPTEIVPFERHRGRNKFGWNAVTEAPHSEILPPVNSNRYSKVETTSGAITENLSETTVNPESLPTSTSAQQTDKTQEPVVVSTFAFLDESKKKINEALKESLEKTSIISESAPKETVNAAVAAVKEEAEKLTQTVTWEVANINKKLTETSAEVNKQISEPAKQSRKVIDRYTHLVSDAVSAADEALVDITTSEDSPPEIVPVERHRGQNKLGWNAVYREILPPVNNSRYAMTSRTKSSLIKTLQATESSAETTTEVTTESLAETTSEVTTESSSEATSESEQQKTGSTQKATAESIFEVVNVLTDSAEKTAKVTQSATKDTANAALSAIEDAVKSAHNLRLHLIRL